MELEYGLVENALHSLKEAMNYYSEGDEEEYATQYKFSILLAAHCAELLLKKILRRNHPALLYEDIDAVKDIHNDDNQTVGYKTAIQRVKKLCEIDLRQYEKYLVELGRVRNRIQHYKYNINGEYHKEVMVHAFSAIEFLFQDVLGFRFDDYDSIIDSSDIEFLHEDVAISKARKAEIAKEFKSNREIKFRFEYAKEKFIDVCCPICGTECLSVNSGIKCKFCGAEFENYEDIHTADYYCTTSQNILRELGRRKHLIRSRIFECPECENDSVIELENRDWMCLVCGFTVENSIYCDECGDEIPDVDGIYEIAISETDTEDFMYLCPSCAKRYREDEEYIGYEIN